MFKLSKFLLRLLKSCSEELNFTVMLSTVKYLVCFLGTELKKLMFKPKESLTPIKY